MTGLSSEKCYLLTGCASGIGRHLTGQMLARGHSVVATDLAYDKLLKVAEEDGWPEEKRLCLELNVTDSANWDDVFAKAQEKFSTLDGVLNIAGYLQAAWVHELEERDIDLHFNVNVKGVILGTHKAAKIMKAQGFGHIINIASMAALAPIPGLSLYSASKYAVRSFSLAAAQELRAHGVYVSVLCPDAVQTPMLDKQKNDARAAMTFSGPKRFLQ
ncbi:MAG: SDR family oxidoreductase, partial [Planctomycetota bacterium]|nr:SDR family oxidoreductase [Planctomycetota bacterium]